MNVLSVATQGMQPFPAPLRVASQGFFGGTIHTVLVNTTGTGSVVSTQSILAVINSAVTTTGSVVSSQSFQGGPGGPQYRPIIRTLLRSLTRSIYRLR